MMILKQVFSGEAPVEVLQVVGFERNTPTWALQWGDLRHWFNSLSEPRTLVSG
jgi:hypothetical protein